MTDDQMGGIKKYNLSTCGGAVSGSWFWSCGGLLGPTSKNICKAEIELSPLPFSTFELVDSAGP